MEEIEDREFWLLVAVSPFPTSLLASLTCILSRDQISSPNDVGVPHNIPTKELFEDACSRLGIEREDHVVLYDTQGVFSSPRAAFTFKVRRFLAKFRKGEVGRGEEKTTAARGRGRSAVPCQAGR